MNTEEILFTSLLAAVIAVMLLRPFVLRQPAPRSVRRRKPAQAPVPRAVVYRMSAESRDDGYIPDIAPLRLGVAHRKIPSVHRYKRETNGEAYSHR